MANPVVEVRNLNKNFGGFLAVDDISFDVGKGEVVGFLGPNGAGKTTTIAMLLGLIKPSGGEIQIFGLNLSQNREEILKRANFASTYSFMQERLTVFENLYVYACLYEVKNPKNKIEKLLEKFEMLDLRNRLAGGLSSGQMTRINLCKALLNDPKLLFLDEPTASLDPDIGEKVRDLLFQIRREGNLSMLYTSHNMDEVAQMCDRVIFLNRGKIVASDTPLNLTKAIEDCFLTLTFEAPLETVKDFCKRESLKYKISKPNTLELTLREERIGEVLTGLAQDGIMITDINIEKPDLEDVFLKIARNNGRRKE